MCKQCIFFVGLMFIFLSYCIQHFIYLVFFADKSATRAIKTGKG